jgi:ankyrin repeat protein
MPKLTHTDLMHVAILLGFSDSGGVCRGFTYMLAQAVLSGDESRFWDRLNLMAEYKDDFDALINEIENIKLKVKKEALLRERDLNLLEIPAFYAGIELYLNSSFHRDIFNQFVPQTNVKEIYRLTKSMALENSDISILLDKDYACNKSTLTLYVNDLAEILKNYLDIPIMLTSSNHSVFLKYNDQNLESPWMYTDTNDFERLSDNLQYYRELSTTELIRSLFISLGGWKHIVFNTTIIVDTAHPLNHEDLLQKFDLKYGVNSSHIKMHDVYGGSLLFLACQNGHIDLVAQLLSQEYIEINAISHGASPLFIACQNGHSEIVKQLLAHKDIKINTAGRLGATALYMACAKGHVEVVAQLLAQEGIKINKATHHGVTPLYIACQMGHVEVVDLLLQTNKTEVNGIGLQQHTPLLVACLSPHTQGKDKLFRQLLEYNADLQHVNDEGQTALDIAFLQQNNSAIKEIFLYAKKSDLSLDLLMAPETKNKALQWANELSVNGFFDANELVLKKFIQQNINNVNICGNKISGR